MRNLINASKVNSKTNVPFAKASVLEEENNSVSGGLERCELFAPDKSEEKRLVARDLTESVGV